MSHQKCFRHCLLLQVGTLQERLCELEQDKEKWMLDIELQQMKYEKLLQVLIAQSLQLLSTQAMQVLNL